MATAIAYGSISIVDTTDIGEFSVQPMSNLPLTVIYDADHTSFTPSWGDSNLRITPVVYYAGAEVALANCENITWERQEGVGAYGALTSGETIVENGILKVSQNKFTANSTSITYIVTAVYLEPISGQALTAKGQITFSLIKNAIAAKNCTITGQNIFKYNTDQQLIGSASIVLTGKVDNVSITAWQYKNGSGDWQTYPNSGTASTLTVNATDNVFTNDKCVIKLATSDSTVYDLHTITKLRDGAAGTATVSGVLTNDDQMIPFTSGGVGDFSSAISRVIIYEGGIDTTNTWTITQAYDNVTAIASKTTANNDTVTVSAMSANTGNVTFTCKKTGYNDIVKTFSLVKVASGADGTSPTIYMLEVDTLALNKDISDPPVFTPSSVTFTSYSQTGSAAKQLYGGRFEIYENMTLAEYDAATTTQKNSARKYYSSSNESSHTYTPSSSANTILCIQYEAGARTNRLDTQLVVVTSDGATGEQGETGETGASAINVIIGNYSDILSCKSDETLIAQQTIRIPFSAYEGTTKIPCSITSVQLLGITPTKSDATASADGYIQWILPSGKAIGSANGTLSLTFTATTSRGSVSIVENYSWSRSTSPANTVFLQVTTPSGTNTITDTISSVTMQAQLLDGSEDKTSSVTSYQWAKYISGTYTNVSGATSSFLTVQDADVQSYASYRLTARYNGKDYIAYFSVFDKHDPIQVEVLSSVGTQLVNGTGAGAIYAKVSRNGQEIDTMYSENFRETPPENPSNGDYYYYVDKTNKTVTLKIYSSNNSSWTNSSNTYSGTYKWSWRDKNGNTITEINNLILPTQGKVIYIDGDYVDIKIVADVQVTI